METMADRVRRVRETIAEAALSVVRGEAVARKYSGKPVFEGFGFE